MHDNDQFQEQRQRHSLDRMSYAEKGRFFKLRNILNIIFIITAIAGMAMFYWKSQQIGGAMLIFAVVVKLAECVLRIIK